MRYATNYDVGDRKRPTGINEDSIALSVFEQGHREGYRGRVRGDDGGADSRPVNRSAVAFALADGAGGHEAGDVASYIAATVVCERLAAVAVRGARAEPTAFDVPVECTPPVPGAADLRGAVADAITTAHRTIIANAVESGADAYATVVAGVVANGQVHYGWVGDSRAYVCNAEHGTIDRLTRDHAVVEQLHEAGDVDEVAVHVHPRGNEITRALGGTPADDPETATVEVETNTVSLYAEDTLLVTSDGLIDAQTDAPALYEAYVDAGRTDELAEQIREQVVTDDEILETVLDADSLADATLRLGTLANDRGGRDNVSVLLLADDALDRTPDDLPTRDIDATPVEDRETRIISGE